MQGHLRYQRMDDGREGCRHGAQPAAHQMDLPIAICLEQIEYLQHVMNTPSAVGLAQHQAMIRVHEVAVIVVKEIVAGVLVCPGRELADTSDVQREANLLAGDIRGLAQQHLLE